MRCNPAFQSCCSLGSRRPRCRPRTPRRTHTPSCPPSQRRSHDSCCNCPRPAPPCTCLSPHNSHTRAVRATSAATMPTPGKAHVHAHAAMSIGSAPFQHHAQASQQSPDLIQAPCAVRIIPLMRRHTCLAGRAIARARRRLVLACSPTARRQALRLCHHDTLGNATRVALLLLRARRLPASQATQRVLTPAAADAAAHSAPHVAQQMVHAPWATHWPL